jgi:hypothetical protein
VKLDQEMLAPGGKMLLSAKRRRQNNNASHNLNHPSSSDFQESTDHRSISPGKTSQPKVEDSLVEHVLDFLDKYPVCHASQVPFTEYLRA